VAYFANGTEGMIFYEQCINCLHEDPGVGCPIALVQMIYNYEQLDKGNEKLRECLNHLVNESGICQMKPLIDEVR